MTDVTAQATPLTWDSSLFVWDSDAGAGLDWTNSATYTINAVSAEVILCADSVVKGASLSLTDGFAFLDAIRKGFILSRSELIAYSDVGFGGTYGTANTKLHGSRFVTTINGARISSSLRGARATVTFGTPKCLLN